MAEKERLKEICGRCSAMSCFNCGFRHFDTEYAFLEAQEKRLKEALQMTQMMMDNRLLEMRIEYRNGRR